MNLKLILLPLTVPVELIAVLLTGQESGFGNWVVDRKLGDPQGKLWQTRDQAIEEARERYERERKEF